MENKIPLKKDISFAKCNCYLKKCHRMFGWIRAQPLVQKSFSKSSSPFIVHFIKTMIVFPPPVQCSKSQSSIIPTITNSTIIVAIRWDLQRLANGCSMVLVMDKLDKECSSSSAIMRWWIFINSPFSVLLLNLLQWKVCFHPWTFQCWISHSYHTSMHFHYFSVGALNRFTITGLLSEKYVLWLLSAIICCEFFNKKLWSPLLC